MSIGVNRVTIVGNICADPDVRCMPTGTAVTTMNVATNESWIDKNTGQKQERAEFHQITLFSGLGEIAGKYCKKGDPVYIQGKLRTEKWQDKDTGKNRYQTKIIASEMQLLGRKRDASDSRATPVSEDAKTKPEYDDDIPF